MQPPTDWHRRKCLVHGITTNVPPCVADAAALLTRASDCCQPLVKARQVVAGGCGSIIAFSCFPVCLCGCSSSFVGQGATCPESISTCVSFSLLPLRAFEHVVAYPAPLACAICILSFTVSV